MPLIPSFGTAVQTSDIALMLTDQLNGMGDFLTQDVGSLNWCEAMTNARSLATVLQYITLLSNQLSPNSCSIFLDRWAAIYNTLGLSVTKDIENYIELKQAEFGTPPTLNNINTYLNDTIGAAPGGLFIDVEWTPELQNFATTDPVTQVTLDGYAYKTPLYDTLVYVWQPRDGYDNLLMPNSIFNVKVESWRAVMESWNPSYITFITMNLTNRGFQDGYANNYNGLNYNNYLDGYNVINATAGSTTITGTGTAFLLYPTGHIGDFAGAVNEGYKPPIQVIDDNGVLQTYFVSAVASNTSLTITTPILNNITNRTYRTLGFILDTDGILDFGGLFNI